MSGTLEKEKRGGAIEAKYDKLLGLFLDMVVLHLCLHGIRLQYVAFDSEALFAFPLCYSSS